MARVIEIKTPNCTRCKLFEPEYQRIQAENPNHKYDVLVFGIDPEAQVIATKHNIRSAPTFVIQQEGLEDIVVKQEELEETIKSLE